MASIALGYGSTRLDLSYDADRLDILAPDGDPPAILSGFDLGFALSSPIESPPLEEFVEPTDRMLIVVPDATRAAGTERVAALLLMRLCDLGVPDEHISVLVGGGIHRPPTDAEVASIVGSAVAERVTVHRHDACDPRSHVNLGTTTRGTPVAINRRIVEADHVILVGAIAFHYFAGFTGGRKALLPGCASEASIRANHMLALDMASLARRAGVGPGRLDGNAVHEDMEEAARMLEPSFSVNTVVNPANEIANAYAGHWRQAHRRGCAEYAGSHAVAVNSRRPLVVVSCGGTPRDINLIQAHKAMEHASGVLEDGGVMVMLAECSEGLGRPDFAKWFIDGGSKATAQMLARQYEINGQTAWALRTKAERFNIKLLSSLDDELVRRMGMEPQHSLERAVPDGVDGYILPFGGATLPYCSVQPAST